MSAQQELIKRLEERSAIIGIIGLGYVGLPLMLRYVELGYHVLGFDNDPSKVEQLNAGQSPIEHIHGDQIADAVSGGLFEATSDMSRASQADALIICVPTPLDRYRQPDLSYVVGTTDAVVPYLRSGQVVSLESTTYPGTTEEELAPRIGSGGLKVGEEIFLVYSPEREDPANPDFKTQTIPKVCGGYSPACQEVGQALYGQVVDRVVPVSSARAAEMTKLLENIHRAVNIGLVNEMKMVADRMGIDIYEVIDAAATKPFGFVPYYPGPGLGGHCIPIDPFYLTWKAREYGLNTRFIELAGEVNSGMPEWVLRKLADALNARGKAVHGSRILILGIAYKKNVDDMRESPAVEMMEYLREQGAVLAYSDPHVPSFPPMREHQFDLEHTPISEETLAAQDCVLIATDHAAVDYDQVQKYAPLILDTRGVYRDRTDPKIVRA
ncbi:MULTISPECIES: nucleotide sugar dehydrogenase [unclassified Thioalkalivibrio]|uniref:nucleotide sugar dehydrogenase n=1 Tax=unclassified Thioalkalivibrio TaxID=2621013 RepID=UPI00037B9D3A|nr:MULTISPECIES: nucleotide sugar dehydrogenase [unclassified Thioalkalivibrio]